MASTDVPSTCTLYFFEYTLVIELGTAVESRLSAKGEQYAVGLFFLENLLYEVGGNGQKIDLVGNAFRGLYRSDVGVDENGFYALLFHRFQGL